MSGVAYQPYSQSYGSTATDLTGQDTRPHSYRSQSRSQTPSRGTMDSSEGSPAPDQARSSGPQNWRSISESRHLRPISLESTRSADSMQSSAGSMSGGFAEDLATLTEDIPFLRADYSLDAGALAPRDSTAVRDARSETSNCLSFEEGDVVMSHWIDPSGWANASLLRTGKRGWVPINYFSPYTNIRAVALLSAVANFVALPKSFPIRSIEHSAQNQLDFQSLSGPQQISELGEDDTEYTFSQASINEIVSGVRALLENSGTLSRSSSLTARSPRLARCRKQVLTELAYLVSVARKNKRTTDDQIIEKLVRTTLRIVERAVNLLDVYDDEVSLNERTSALYDVSPTSFRDVDSVNGMSLHSSTRKLGHSEGSAEPPSSGTQMRPQMTRNTYSNHSLGAGLTEGEPGEPKSRPGSVMMHKMPPAPQIRVDEISKALFDSFNIFIDINAVVESPDASLKILKTTRHCMLACRELLVVVEAISTVTEQTGDDLEQLKDSLFAGIRQLVTAARGFVNSLSVGGRKHDSSATRLTTAARDCMRSSCDCASWCREILAVVKSIQLPASRDYPMLTGEFYDDQDNSSLDSPMESSGSGTQSLTETRPAKQLAPDFRDELDSDVLDSITEIAENERDAAWLGLSPTTELAAPLGSFTPKNESPRSMQPKELANTMLAGEDPVKAMRECLTPEPSAPTEGSASNFGSTAGSGPVTTADPLTPPRNSSQREQEMNLRAAVLARSPHIRSPLRAPTLASPRASNKPVTTVGYNTPFVGTDSHLSSDLDRQLAAIHPHLHVRNDKVRAGTVPALVAWLLTSHASNNDRISFLFVFHIFTTATTVADAISEAIANSNAERKSIISFVKLWIESFWRYEDGVVFKHLDRLCEYLNHPQLTQRLQERKQASESCQLVQRALDGPEISSSNSKSQSTGNSTDKSSDNSRESSLGSATRRAPSGTLRGAPNRRLSHEDIRGAANAWNNALSRLGSGSAQVTGQKLLEYDATEVAARLFEIDNSIMKKVEAEELLEKHYSASKRALGLAPNVVDLVMFSNRLSAFVGDSILADSSTNNKVRRNILRAWIRVADRCFENGDLNATVSIVSTLRSTSISRLRRAFDMLSPKKLALLEKLGKLTTPERNFAEYRRELRARAGQVCIPYMGLYLADLTLLEEGCSKERKINGISMINFERFRRTADIIRGFQAFQTRLPNPESTSIESSLSAWLKSEMEHSHKVAKDDEHTYRRSCLIEPPA